MIYQLPPFIFSSIDKRTKKPILIVFRNALLTYCFFIFLPFHCFAFQTASATSNDSTTALNYIYKAGDNGYACFRIPALICTKHNVLLAFAEGRKTNCGDAGNIDLVLKRSEDGGKNWSNLQVVWDDSTNTCGNPVPIEDATTGKILLICSWNLGTDHEKQILSNASNDGRRVFILSSNDEGKTWTSPKEITQQVKKEGWTWYATGPCHGLQIMHGKYKGRLVVPVNHVENSTKKNYAHIIYSDDHGLNWKLGNDTPQDQMNETTVAELSKGRLMLNMRNSSRTNKTRQIAISDDGGQTWGNTYTDTTLIEPVCQGSLLNYNPSKRRSELFFINPASKTSRSNLTLRLSKDEGETWSCSKIIYPGPAAYSDIAIFRKDDLACVYEAGIVKPYEGIAFKIINIDELK